MAEFAWVLLATTEMTFTCGWLRIELKEKKKDPNASSSMLPSLQTVGMPVCSKNMLHDSKIQQLAGHDRSSRLS